MKKIPIYKPYITEKEKEAIIKPLETGWLVQGKYVKKLEKKFCDYTGAKFAAAVNSCTSAQMILSKCIDIGQGDEVIVPAFTWISTANSIEHFGAKPVFTDINLNTYNIDTESITEKITSKTKAIYPVNLFGLPADLPDICKISRKYRLKIIEDCACSLGAFIGKKHTGLFGTCGCFSMHPRKSITTGEGGMIITNNKKIYNMAVSLRDHGSDRSDFQRHYSNKGFLLPQYNYCGYNFRLTDIHASLGLAQFKNLRFIQSRKKYIARKYYKLLKDIRFLKTPFVPENYTHSYQSFVCLFMPDDIAELSYKDKNFVNKVKKLNKKRNNFLLEMKKYGISLTQGTHCVTIQNYYSKKYGFKPEDYPKSFIVDKLSVSLPIYPTLSEDEIEYVISSSIKAGKKVGILI